MSTHDVASLKNLVETYEDTYPVRVRFENRLRSIVQGGAPPPPELEAAVAVMLTTEHQLELAIGRIVRRHPLWKAWGKGVKGLGEKTFGIIISCLEGDPLVAYPSHWEPGEDEKRVLVVDPPFERMLSQLWQYAGHGRAAKRRAGMAQSEALALGNPTLKKWVHLASECMLKAGNREMYDLRRARTSNEDHWKSDGHRHNDALRIQGKELLRGMYEAALQLRTAEGESITTAGAPS